MIKGKYIVIEGPEGVGKTTQVLLLSDALRKAGLPVKALREPNHENDITTQAIRRLMQDPSYPMNTRSEVLLFNAARSQMLDTIKNNCEQGITCVVDRNYLTTLAMQYYGRGDVPDYQKINAIISFAVGEMEPDLTIVLDAEVPALRERLRGQYQGDRFNNLDDAFLERIRAGYLWEAKQRGLQIVYAVGGIEDVFKEVWKLAAVAMAQRQKTPAVAAEAVSQPQSVAEILARQPALGQAAEAVKQQETNTSDEPFFKKGRHGHHTITEAGRSWLQTAITNIDSDVFLFRDKLENRQAAAALARLNQRQDSLRIILLDEFAAKTGEQTQPKLDTAKLPQKLVNLHAVIEDASQLHISVVMRHRQLACLAQSVASLDFSQKDASDQYNYFVPPNLKPATKKRYRLIMDQLLDTHSEVVRKLTAFIQDKSTVPEAERDENWQAETRRSAQRIAQPMLPIAAKSTLGVSVSVQDLQNLATSLIGSAMLEDRAVGQKLHNELRGMLGESSEDSAPDKLSDEIHSMARKLLPENHASEVTAVQLTEYWPHNELDLVADILYEHSSLPLKDLQAQVQSWPYNQKANVFNTYLRERMNQKQLSGFNLEKATYSWDLLVDHLAFSELLQLNIADLTWQPLTPRYGYEIPEPIEQAGLTESFERCFDLSLELFSTMQAAGHEAEAQYATLLGHKLRLKVTQNAEEVFRLFELNNPSPSISTLLNLMHEKLAEAHPLMAEAIKFTI